MSRNLWMAVWAALGVCAAPCVQGGGVAYWVVKVQNVDRSFEYRTVDREELDALTEALSREKRTFPRALDAARKEWEGNPSNGVFPALRLTPRRVFVLGGFRDSPGAQRRLDEIRRGAPPQREPELTRLRVEQAAAMVEQRLRTLPGAAAHVPFPAAAPGEPSVPLVARELLELHNQARAREGLPPLALKPGLTAAAQKYADFMARTLRYGHEENGDVRDRAEAEGVRSPAIGENIARGYLTPRAVMGGWMGSPGHRHNIMGVWSGVGFGVAPSPAGSYWVADFAR